MSNVPEKSTSKTKVWIIPVVIAAIALSWIGWRVAFPDSSTIFAGTRPTNLGVESGKLTPCPSSPNCVSSQSEDAAHYINPIDYESSDAEAFDKLTQIITSQPQTQIIKVQDNYIEAEFTTHWMGFVDDVEFYLDSDTKQIEVRSASRLGEGDLGVNRQRIETIRNLFTQA